DAPNAELIAGQWMIAAVPTVEVAGQIQCIRPRRPFSIPDARLALQCAAVEPEVFVSAAEVRQRALRCNEIVEPLAIAGVAMAKRRRIGRQPGIEFDQAGSVGVRCMSLLGHLESRVA